MAAACEEVYPVFLKLGGKPVLVVGAGSVAARKIGRLIDAGAVVRVVAPRACAAVEQEARAGRITWEARGFEDRDADGVWLVVAATSDADVQRRVASAAERHRTFVVAVDDRLHATAYSGAVVRRPPVTVAISSSGATPALTRLLREIIEQLLPSDDWIQHAERIRARWTALGTPIGDRFAELVRELAAKSP